MGKGWDPKQTVLSFSNEKTFTVKGFLDMNEKFARSVSGRYRLSTLLTIPS